MRSNRLKERKANPQNITINIEKLSDHIIIAGDNVDVEKVKEKIAEALSKAIDSLRVDDRLKCVLSPSRKTSQKECSRMQHLKNLCNLKSLFSKSPIKKPCEHQPQSSCDTSVNRYHNVRPLRQDNNILPQEERESRTGIKESENSSERILTVTLKIPKVHRENT